MAKNTPNASWSNLGEKGRILFHEAIIMTFRQFRMELDEFRESPKPWDMQMLRKDLDDPIRRLMQTNDYHAFMSEIKQLKQYVNDVDEEENRTVTLAMRDPFSFSFVYHMLVVPYNKHLPSIPHPCAWE